MLTTELPLIAERHRDVQALSVYLSVPPDAPDPLAHARIALRSGIANARDRMVTASHVERTTFEACADRLAKSLADTLTQLRGHTWVGFAVADGAVYNVTIAALLPPQTPAVVAWDTGLRVAPYYALDAFTGASLALMDHEHAALFRVEGDELDEIARFETKANVETGSHMGSPPRRSFHAGTHGTPAADVAARQISAATARHRARILKALSLQNGARRIFLGGASDTTTRVAADLPRVSNAHAVVVPTVSSRSSAPQILDAVRALDQEERDTEALAMVEDTLATAYGSRVGVLGEGPVAAALAQQAVARVVISTGLFERNTEGVERLVRDGLAQRADVRIVHGRAAERLDATAAGVAAALRFPLSNPAGEA